MSFDQFGCRSDVVLSPPGELQLEESALDANEFAIELAGVIANRFVVWAVSELLAEACKLGADRFDLIDSIGQRIDVFGYRGRQLGIGRDIGFGAGGMDPPAP